MTYMHVTPSDIEVMLHYYGTPGPHPRIHAPAVIDATKKFLAVGLIARGDPISKKGDMNTYHATERGQIWVKMLCSIQPPECVWLDRNVSVIYANGHILSDVVIPEGADHV